MLSESPRQVTKSQNAFDLGILFLLPWALFWVNQEWIYSNPHILPWYDPFVYLGLFWFAPDFIPVDPSHYPVTRLAWILPGHLFYAVFSPATANMLFKVAVFYVNTFSFYFTSRLLFGRFPAVLSALLLGTYSYFLQTAGWDYVDSAVIAYSFLGLLFLTLGAKEIRRPVSLIAAGCTMAMMVSSNLFAVVFVPFQAAYYFVVRRYFTGRWGSPFGVAAYGMVGATAGLLLLAAVSVHWGGKFLFLEPQFAAADFLGSGNHKFTLEHWSIPVRKWSWSALPLFVSMTGCVFVGRYLYKLVRSGLSKSNPRVTLESPRELLILFFSIQLVALFAFYVKVTLTSIPVLLHWFYVSMLIPPVFLMIAFFVSSTFRDLRQDKQRWVTGFVSLLLVLPYLPAVGRTLQNTLRTGYGDTSVGVSVGLMAIAIVIARKQRNRVPGIVGFALVVGVINALLTTQPQLNFSHNRERKTGFEAIYQATDEIRARDEDRDIRVWLNSTTPPHGDNILWATWIAAMRNDYDSTCFPRLAWDENAGPSPLFAAGTKFAILSSDSPPQVVEQANTSLTGVGLQATAFDEVEIISGDIQFWIVFVELTEQSAAGPG
jgi:hypothetical protein